MTSLWRAELPPLTGMASPLRASKGSEYSFQPRRDNSSRRQEQMSRKPLSLIAIVLLVPVAIMTLFAVRTLSVEFDALNLRREHLARQRLDAAKILVQEHIQKLGADVLAETHAGYAAGGVNSLSVLARRRVFTHAFLFRLGVPLHSATALEHQYDIARALQDKAQSLAVGLDKAHVSSAQLVTAGSAYALMRCSTGNAEIAVCIAIDNAGVTRVLRAATNLVARTIGLTHVGLVAPNGVAPGPQPARSLGVTSQPLEGLLQGWTLRADDPSSTADGLQPPIILYLAATAILAGWLATTWMLHRSFVLREEAAAARANVIAQLAHELRTPLTNLKLHTELLLRQSTNAASVERYGVVLNGEIDRLSNLAENAIVVARASMADSKLETAVPDECLSTILARFEPILAGSNCTIQFAPGAGVTSRFDRTAWERCIVNLIDNARKYAPGSEIKIATMQNSETLRLDVSDRGPGIAADQREKIFEPLDRGAATTACGFGLGLAAVRSLARQNGGNCWVETMHTGAHLVLTMRSVPVRDGGQAQAAPC